MSAVAVHGEGQGLGQGTRGNDADDREQAGMTSDAWACAACRAVSRWARGSQPDWPLLLSAPPGLAQERPWWETLPGFGRPDGPAARCQRGAPDARGAQRSAPRPDAVAQSRNGGHARKRGPALPGDRLERRLADDSRQPHDPPGGQRRPGRAPATAALPSAASCGARRPTQGLFGYDYDEDIEAARAPFPGEQRSARHGARGPRDAAGAQCSGDARLAQLRSQSAAAQGPRGAEVG